MLGSCGQGSGAARECCCFYEAGSRGPVLGSSDGLTTLAEVTKTGQVQENTGDRDEILDLDSFSSCWGWDRPLLLGGREGVMTVEMCVG